MLGLSINGNNNKLGSEQLVIPSANPPADPWKPHTLGSTYLLESPFQYSVPISLES